MCQFGHLQNLLDFFPFQVYFISGSIESITDFRHACQVGSWGSPARPGQRLKQEIFHIVNYLTMIYSNTYKREHSKFNFQNFSK